MIKQIQKFRNVAFMVIFVSVDLKAEMFEAGVDYEILPQVIRTADSSKIEIKNDIFCVLSIVVATPSVLTCFYP